MEMRSRGTNSAALYSLLLETLNSSDVESFKNHISRLERDRLDINYEYEYPHYGTLLDIACKTKDKSEFVQVLVDNGAEVNRVNETHRGAPLHFGVKSLDLRTLDCLLKCPRTEVNIKDLSGCTPLHLACGLGQLEQVELLLNHPKVQVNVLDINEKAPIQLALEMSNEDVVSKLLEREDIDIDIPFIEPLSAETVRERISKRLPNLEPVLLAVRQREQDRVDRRNVVEKLFFYLRKCEFSSFESLVKENANFVDSDNGGHTMLQYACEYGLYDFVKILVACGADINHTIPSNRETGLMIACKQGYHKIVGLLINQNLVSLDPVGTEYILFLVIKNLRSEKSQPSGASNSRDYVKCLREILKEQHLKRLDINRQDSIGNTVLHYAAKKGNQDIIISLLDNGAYVGIKNKFGDPPSAYISPKILEAYLDQCVYDDKELATEYEIIFKYDFLVPPQSTDDTESLETDPLLYMTTSSNLRPLLMHPVLTSFIHIKWYCFRHLLYYNLSFYALFCLLLTAYIFITCHTAPQSVDGNENRRNCTNSTSLDSICLLWWSLLVSLALHILQESIRVFLLFVSIQPTITVECLLKIFLVIVTSMILVGEPKELRNQISAVGILFSWTELLLLFGRYRSLSLATNIAMFKTVTESFFKFLKLYSILLLAFALSFYLLFKDSNKEDGEFSDPYSSVLKTIVMMTGEFDYGSIPFAQENTQVLSQAASHFLFVLFVFLMAVVLVNLLNGLAVSDTQAIQKDAELFAYASRVELISYIEKMALKVLIPIQDFAVRTPLRCCLPKRFLTCKTNLFDRQSPTSGFKVRVLPNQKNRVRVSQMALDRGYGSNSCFADSSNVIMKESIVGAAKGVLQKRCEEADKSDKVAMELSRKLKRREMRKRLDEYGLRLEKLEALIQHSHGILNKNFSKTVKESENVSS